MVNSALSATSDFYPLPAGWRWTRLGAVCIQDRRIIDPGSQVAAARPYLSLEHIESNTGRILRTPAEAMEDEGVSTSFAFDARHVLYGKLRPYLNKVALPDFAGRCTTELIPFLPQGMERDFLAWILRRRETIDAAMRERTGSRMPRANMDDLLALEIPFPPLPEQRRIAAILNEQMAAVERARVAAEAQLAAAKALPAAYLRKVFESEEARQWPKKRLGEVAISVQNGIYKTAENYGQGHPFLRMYNLQNTSWNLVLEQMASVLLQGKDNETFGLRTGDLLVSRVNSFELVGKCAWVGPVAEGYVFENMLIRVRLEQSVDSLFVAQQMNSHPVREQIQLVAKRAIGQASINAQDLRSVAIVLPSLDAQRVIARNLDHQMEASTKAYRTLQTQLAAINHLPAALLLRAFNGEL